MAANINFRIQITSFAASAPLVDPKGGSIGRGDGPARPGAGEKPSPDSPGHRNQLHPTHRSPDKAEAGCDPSERQVQQPQRDQCGQRSQHEGHAGNPERRKARNQARIFKLSIRLIYQWPATRVALYVRCPDWQFLLDNSRHTHAPVLQVTAP